MRVSSDNQSSSAMASGVGFREAEALFRAKPVAEIRNVEANTRKQIEDKKEELRQLIGTRYRDLIDSADSILSMKSSCELISSNIASISNSVFSLSSNNVNAKNSANANPIRIKIYGVASRVKYLVDTPENIWGCLDEFMFLEASERYIRAKLVHQGLSLVGRDDGGMILKKNFPLLNHQWQIVESFKGQISQRSRERLLVMVDKEGGSDVWKVPIAAFADALAGVAIIDELDPKQAFGLFLDSRKSWILQKLSSFEVGEVVEVLCEVTRIIQVTIAHVGEMFLQVLNDMPLFYKVILESPPAAQLFGGILNPDEEVRLWNAFREKLESIMVVLDREFVAKACSSWLRECGREIVKKIDGKCLIEGIPNGAELASAEKLIRETLDCKDVLQGSLEWLKSVFGSDIELPWSRTRELVLEENVDLWDEIFEGAFVSKMKVIIDSGFHDMTKAVNISESVLAAGGNFDDDSDFRAFCTRSSADGGVWFIEPNVKKVGIISGMKALREEYDFGSCLSSYFGPEASHIRDAVDSCCRSVLEDLLFFLESPKASLRLKDLSPYLQNKCYESVSSILTDLTNELDKLRAALDNVNKGGKSPSPAAIIERSLFIGRLLFAFRNHSKHIPVVLGSPRFWVNETLVASVDNLPSLSRYPRFSLESSALDNPNPLLNNSKRQTSLAACALYGVNESTDTKLEQLMSSMRELSIVAHGLWISWVSDELTNILLEDLRVDDALSATYPLRGWEEVVVKQDQSSESGSEMKVLLPSMPSLYICSFLFRACEEVHRIGGHVLDKTILQQFAKRLIEKVIGIYSDLVTNGMQVSEKGILQVLLDLRFAEDVLSGYDLTFNEGLSRNPSTKYSYRRKQDRSTTKSATRERIDDLINRFSQRLDPIDWQTFEPYLWENERQSYLRHAVLFGFFVQLNRLYTDTVQKLPTNSESNIMRCSTVPRFKYLPISAPALSSRAATKAPVHTSSDDVSSRSPWKSMANGEFSPNVHLDDNLSFGVAAPFLKSVMQVGSRFGEGTFKLGSLLTDSRLKDRSAGSMSFGDILPVQAAGLLSSFTATRSDS